MGTQPSAVSTQHLAFQARTTLTVMNEASNKAGACAFATVVKGFKDLNRKGRKDREDDSPKANC